MSGYLLMVPLLVTVFIPCFGQDYDAEPYSGNAPEFESSTTVASGMTEPEIEALQMSYCQLIRRKSDYKRRHLQVESNCLKEVGIFDSDVCIIVSTYLFNFTRLI